MPRDAATAARPSGPGAVAAGAPRGPETSSPMGKRILIMSASVGSGHVRAAEALAQAFRAAPEVEEVICDDALEHSNLLFKELNASLYAALAEIAPDFLGWWYERTNEPWKSDKVQRAFELLNTGPLVEFVNRL